MIRKDKLKRKRCATDIRDETAGGCNGGKHERVNGYEEGIFESGDEKIMGR